MRADIHDGPEHMLQSEAGYIDARPLTPARQNLLQRTAGPYIRVKRVDIAMSELLSAIHNTGHYHVRWMAVCLSPSWRPIFTQQATRRRSFAAASQCNFNCG